MQTEQSITITRQQLQDCQNHHAHGELEGALLRLLAKLKTENAAQSLLVRLDFPDEGGVTFQCRRGWRESVAWKLGKAVRLWDE